MTEPLFRVSIECERCWGRYVAEDSACGACMLCVELCPEIFEKPRQDESACVRGDADPLPFLIAVIQACQLCPTQAIHVA